MKKLFSLLTAIGLSAVLFVAPLADAATVVAISISSSNSGTDWISVNYNGGDFTPLGDDVFALSCYSSTMNRTHKVIEPNAGGYTIVTQLVPGERYDCRVILYDYDPTGAIVYPAEKATSLSQTIWTQSSSTKLSFAQINPGATSLEFSVNPVDKTSYDYYFVECLHGTDVLNVTSNLPTGMKISNLSPSTKYSCRPAMKRDSVVYYAGDFIDIYTVAQGGGGSAYVSKATPSTTEVNFEIGGVSLLPNQEYWVQCRDGQNKESVAKTTTNQVNLTGLTAGTTYNCFVTIRDRTSGNVAVAGGPNTVVTTLTSSSVVTVNSISPGETSVQFVVSGGNLKATDFYLFRCDNASNGVVASWATSKNTTYVLGGLTKQTSYSCYAAVAADNSGAYVTGTKSAATSLTTQAAVVPPVNKDLAPGAKFEDKPITDWGLYKNPFPDTSLNDLEGKAAAELFRRQVIQGYPDGEFKGYKDVSRAEAAKFLVLARYGNIGTYGGSELFPDVEKGSWYETFVGFCHLYGIIAGYPDGTFKPTNTINRAEFTKMMVRAFSLEENLPMSWTDVPSNEWFAKYAGAAGKYNFFPHTDRNVPQMYPGKLMSRYDVAMAIHQYLLNR